MRRLSKPYPVRLNPSDDEILTNIINSLSPEQTEALIAWDRSERDGWRNFSGRPPQATALILRRVVHLGLVALLQELPEA
jgi:hypothetical protein